MAEYTITFIYKYDENQNSENKMFSFFHYDELKNLLTRIPLIINVFGQRLKCKMANKIKVEYVVNITQIQSLDSDSISAQFSSQLPCVKDKVV